MAAPIPVKSQCLLLFTKKFSQLYEMQQLILGISYAIQWMLEPYYMYNALRVNTLMQCCNATIKRSLQVVCEQQCEVPVLQDFPWQQYLVYCNKLECLPVSALLHPCQIFWGKARSQLFELSPVRSSTLVSSSFAGQYQTRVEVTDSRKHSNL